jgi:stage III sporulation protein AB
MLILKYIIIILIFFTSVSIGDLVSKKYILRVKELKEFKNAFNIIETKIKFTYEPLSNIFIETSKLLSKNVAKIFESTVIYMKQINAGEAWNKSLEECETNLNKEDIENIKNFGKMLGTVDKDGQISMLEVTKNFIEMQIDKAKTEENKSSKLYKTLGVIVGLAFIVILI